MSVQVLVKQVCFRESDQNDILSLEYRVSNKCFVFIQFHTHFKAVCGVGGGGSSSESQLF